MMAISIIVEDCQKLFEEEEYHELISYMVSAVLNLLYSNITEKTKSYAINAINVLLFT